uniref:protein-serine/threonine phosphatase n=1 Tax=Romanomermis culicivorax TaxID=13658 RepID=A0A915KGP8_ROMCU
MKRLFASDPSHDTTTKGWAESSRGSRMFGTDEVSMFCRCFDVDMIIRAHEVQLDGYLFECDNHLVTVFSAINYTNQFNNAAGVVCIDEKMKLSVKCLKPSGPPVALSSVTSMNLASIGIRKFFKQWSKQHQYLISVLHQRSCNKDTVSVGRFPQNCSYPFRPKIDFQAERLKLLTICSVTLKKKKKREILRLLSQIQSSPLQNFIFYLMTTEVIKNMTEDCDNQHSQGSIVKYSLLLERKVLGVVVNNIQSLLDKAIPNSHRTLKMYCVYLDPDQIFAFLNFISTCCKGPVILRHEASRGTGCPIHTKKRARHRPVTVGKYE